MSWFIASSVIFQNSTSCLLCFAFFQSCMYTILWPDMYIPGKEVICCLWLYSVAIRSRICSWLCIEDCLCWIKLNASGLWLISIASLSSWSSICMLRSPKSVVLLNLDETFVSRLVMPSRKILFVNPSWVPWGGWYTPRVVWWVDSSWVLYSALSKLSYWVWDSASAL